LCLSQSDYNTGNMLSKVSRPSACSWSGHLARRATTHDDLERALAGVAEPS